MLLISKDDSISESILHAWGEPKTLSEFEDLKAENAAINKIMLGQVLTAIDALPAHHRSTMQLVCVDGHTYAETAEILGISVGTVMSRVFMARKRLRAKLL